MKGSDHGDVEGSEAGSSSGTGKRKRLQGRDRGVGGFGSSDGKQLLDYKGVLDCRFVAIEPCGEGASLILDVTGMSAQRAAMVHDLATAYADPDHFDVEQLNIRRLADEVIQDLALLCPPPSTDELKTFLIDFVHNHPLKDGGANPKEWGDSVKDGIVALALCAFQELNEWIFEELYQAGAGFQRLDLGEIYPAVEGGEPLEASENAEEADVFSLRILMTMLLAPPGAPESESNLTDLTKYLLREIQRLEALLEAKDSGKASLNEAKGSGSASLG